MTPAEHAIAVQALIDQLAPTVSDASRTVPHTVILAALIHMFRVTARNSPGCAETAANVCMSIAMELSIHQARQLPPAGAPIH